MGFQSTHPRRVWLFFAATTKLNFTFQSTHPRRVWQLAAFYLFLLTMFQSTHPRRVWQNEGHEIAPSRSFNPHTHEGCDTLTCGPLVCCQCFNPHTHEGCDLNSDFFYIHIRAFQSTHPRRVWLRPPLGAQRTLICFNPHTHEGCDK